ELAGPKVHAETKVGMELRMKNSGAMFSDFIAKARKVNDPVEFVAGGTWHLITFRHVLNEAGNS
ncbi:hypothetical protein N8465_01890, partial [Akkermansiaceae bacterium]|nr:hypothetical protein [Akkermansiaceae bacterium]